VSLISKMKPDARTVIEHVLEVGIGAGIRRYYKHRDDAPDTKEQMRLASEIEGSIMEMMEEWFIFEYQNLE
jgi:hypothetical protein